MKVRLSVCLPACLPTYPSHASYPFAGDAAEAGAEGEGAVPPQQGQQPRVGPRGRCGRRARRRDQVHHRAPEGREGRVQGGVTTL